MYTWLRVRRIVAGRRRFSNNSRCSTGLFSRAEPIVRRAIAPQPFGSLASPLKGPAALSRATPAAKGPKAAPAARAE